ncbi:hypothetical protein ABT160_37615 [Streptomyces sp. NPDC001941]|uniref:hypothetical protein n=1 Tax=Streptomyces sp. NPDC001941 TaxID=3154659 RepID=UPI0033340416
MSVDIAYPVFRTSDRALALSTARRLVEYGRRECSEVSVYGEFGTVAEARRVAARWPEGWFRGQRRTGSRSGRSSRPAGWADGALGSDLPVEPGAYEGQLPVRFDLDDLAVGSVEEAFVRTIGTNTGMVHWHSLAWPEAIELGFDGDEKHAEVMLLLNTGSRELDVPDDGDRVLLHLRSTVIDGEQTREPYAHWLAAQAGLGIIGPGQPS